MRKDVFKKLKERDGNVCCSCGADFNEAMPTLNHIVPKSIGGTDDLENLQLLCDSCNLTASGPKNQIFENNVYSLLANSGLIKEIDDNSVLELRQGGSNQSITLKIQPDIVATFLDGQKIAIECKAKGYISESDIREIATIKNFLPHANNVPRFAIAFPGNVTARAAELAKSLNIELWDKAFLTDLAKRPIANKFEAGNKTRDTKTSDQFTAAELLNQLRNCPSGVNDAYVYQKIVKNIFEKLFPKLSAPKWELPDFTKTNRRDIVFPNYATEGFWKYLGDKYLADFIIIDAKNYTNPIEKNEIIQVANYLKSQGCGLFALIVTRKGHSPAGAEHTLRDQWLLHKKLIIVMNDDDLEDMLTAQDTGNPPEDVIKEKIEKFRLSI